MANDIYSFIPPRLPPELLQWLAQRMAGPDGAFYPATPFHVQRGPQPAPMPPGRAPSPIGEQEGGWDGWRGPAAFNPTDPMARASVSGGSFPPGAAAAGSVGMPGGMPVKPGAGPDATVMRPVPSSAPAIPPNLRAAGPDRGAPGAPVVDPAAIGLLVRAGVLPMPRPPATAAPSPAPSAQQPAPPPPPAAAAAPPDARQIEEWRRLAAAAGQYGMLAPYLPGLQGPTSY